jgi:hypothetical protein
MKIKLLLTCFALTCSLPLAFAQWTGHSSSSDLTSTISRTGMIASDGYNGAQIRLNSQGTYYGKIGNPSSQIWSLGWGTMGTDINPVLTWSATGNVGIGTTSMGGKLDINAGSQYAIRTLTSSRYVIEVRNTSDTDGGWWMVNDPNGSFALHENSIGDQFTIKPGGNTGLGTVSPQARLHVSNGDLLLQNPTSGYPVLWLKDVGGTNTIRMDYNSLQSTGGNLYFRSAANQNIVLNDAGGNVGIGTSVPGSYKLAVEGKIGAREVNVTTAAWSDHVFNTDYKLRPLSEVQHYIEENHHLPEVPSEKEVLANGQNLGEMNAILLKKIEELTLYMIELKKENDTLQQRVSKIEKEK